MVAGAVNVATSSGRRWSALSLALAVALGALSFAPGIAASQALPSPSATETPVPTASSTPARSPTPTPTATPTPLQTSTSLPPVTSTPPATSTASGSTPVAGTPAATPSLVAPTGSATPSPSATPTATATPTGSPTATATATPTGSPTATATATGTATPTATATAVRLHVTSGGATTYAVTISDSSLSLPSVSGLPATIHPGDALQFTNSSSSTTFTVTFTVVLGGEMPLGDGAAPVTLPPGQSATITFPFSGSYRVSVGAPSYSLTSDSPLTVDCCPTLPAGAISISVMDTALHGIPNAQVTLREQLPDGSPVPGVAWAITTTNSDGNTTFLDVLTSDQLSGGARYVGLAQAAGKASRFLCPSWCSGLGAYRADYAAPVVVSAGTQAYYSVQLEASASLTGTLTVAGSSGPVPAPDGLVIRAEAIDPLYGTWTTVLHNGDGSYTIDGLVAGQAYRVRANDAEDPAFAVGYYSPSGGQPSRLTAAAVTVPATGISWTLGAGNALSGRITKAERPGEGVSGAIVRLVYRSPTGDATDTVRQTVTDATGAYSFAHVLPAGQSWTVVALLDTPSEQRVPRGYNPSATGFDVNPSPVTVSVDAGAVSSIDVPLQLGRAVTGQLSIVGLAPAWAAAEGRVEAWRLSDGYWTGGTTTDAAGSFRLIVPQNVDLAVRGWARSYISPLAAGPFTIWLSDPFVVPAGTAAPSLTINTPYCGGISGTISNADGAPLRAPAALRVEHVPDGRSILAVLFPPGSAGSASSSLQYLVCAHDSGSYNLRLDEPGYVSRLAGGNVTAYPAVMLQVSVLAGGSPATGATVSILAPGGARKLGDASPGAAAGTYTLGVLPNVTYLVQASLPGYAPVAKQITTGTTSPVTVTLDLSALDSVAVSGTVSGLSAGTVTLAPADAGYAAVSVPITGSGGAGSFTAHVTPGLYAVRVDGPGAAVEPQVVDLRAAAGSTVPLSLSNGASPGTIAGTVTAAFSLGGGWSPLPAGWATAPAGGAVVEAIDRTGLVAASQTTAPDGSYRLSVAPGTYLISVRFTGYAVTEIEDVAVAAGSTVALDVDLAARNPYLIYGRMHCDWPACLPLAPGVRLTPFGAGQVAFMPVGAQDGAPFTLHVPAGTYLVEGFGDGCVSFGLAWTVSATAPQVPASASCSGGDGGSEAMVSGQVVIGASPATGARVTAYDSTGTPLSSSLTEPDGTFRVMVPWRSPTGDLQEVVVSYAGYAPVAVPVTFDRAATSVTLPPIDLAALDPVTVSGTVSSASGGLNGAVIGAMPTRGDGPASVRLAAAPGAASATYTLHLPPGEALVAVHRPGLWAAPVATAWLAAGSSSTASFTLTPGTVLRGVLILGQETFPGFDSVLVRALDANGRGVAAAVRTRGRYALTLPPPPPGATSQTATLAVDAPGDAEVDVPVSASATAADVVQPIDLPAATASWTSLSCLKASSPTGRRLPRGTFLRGTSTTGGRLLLPLRRLSWDSRCVRVPPGTWTLHVVAPGYYAPPATFTVAGGASQVTYVTVPTFQLSPAAMLAGQLPLRRDPSATPPQRFETDLEVRVFPHGSSVPVAVIDRTFDPLALRTGEHGEFELPLPLVLGQTYDVEIKPAHALGVLITNVTPAQNADGSGAVIDLPSLPVPNEGDVNGDDRVALDDFSLFVTAFGRSQGQPGYDPRTDFNQDGVTDIYDFSLFVSQGNFGSRGPLPAGG
jgi:hypothetical protein